MYMEIHQLLKQGFNKVQVAQKLDISRSTVYRYLERNPEAMSKWVIKTKFRRMKLDLYNDIILSWHYVHPDIYAYKILDLCLYILYIYALIDNNDEIYKNNLYKKKKSRSLLR